MPWFVIEVRKRGSKKHGPFNSSIAAMGKKIKLMEKHKNDDHEFYVQHEKGR